MKIHAYRVFPQSEVSLDQILQHLSEQTLEQRLQSVDDIQLRLEAAEKPGATWFIEFGGIRREGPGKASANTPIEDFDLEDHEGFGHETAACFDGRFLLVQYNHYGPRISRIRKYLSIVGRMLDRESGTSNGASEILNIVPVLKENAQDRLAHMGLVKSIEISFYVPGVLANNGQSRQSLSSLLNNPLIGTADRIRLQVSAAKGRASSLALNQVRQAIDDLLGLREDVSQLEVTAKETEDAPSEAVDFIEARLEADIPIARQGRRYGRDDRWAALNQALQAWRADGRLA